MRVPLSWMKDYAPFEGDPGALASALDDLGLVVEEVEHVGEGLGDVILARVLEIGAIAGADRIRLVTVDAGGEPTEVVCGAWNFHEGDVVPFAPAGSVLPGGFAISRRKMKGVVSNGMLCSGRELGLSDDHEGILVLPGAMEPGTAFTDALGIAPDTVFDIAVEANRPDAWSVAGIARDLAAALRLPFSIPDPPAPPPPSAPVTEPAPANGAAATVEVVDDDLCPRFTARVLLGVEVGLSPDWMVRRLTLAGMRPINNVVDASNYVMLDLGQPTHPYDLDRVGGGGLRVRAARTGETVTTLDGVERRMGERSVGIGDDRRDCLICDAHDVPIGIGGIMGGATSEIGPTTTRVLLEAAYFTPMAIARTSKRLNLRSEASARFERGCDPEGIDRAALHLVTLLGATTGARYHEAGDVLDVRGRHVPGPARVTVRTARVNGVLGSDLDDSQIVDYLEPIGFTCAAEGPGVLEVTVPTFRPDTEREIDVIEEVARHHGYANLPRRSPRAPQVGGLTTYQRERRQVRDVLAGLGAHEAWTPSILGPDEQRRVGIDGGVRVTNPLTPDEVVLRQTLLPGMLRALAFNADRRQGDIRLFEVGHVFPPPGAERVARAVARSGESVVDEREVLGVALAADGDDARVASSVWHVLADAFGVEGVEFVVSSPSGAAGVPAVPPGMHPTRSAHVVLPGAPGAAPRPVAVVGEVDPGVLEDYGLDGARRRVGWLEVDLGVLLGEAPRRSSLVAPVSRFPSSDIDLAFVVDEAVPAVAVRQTLCDAAGALLEMLTLFDVYGGAGMPDGARSLAYRLRLCASDHTLTDNEVAQVRARCIAAVEQAHGATLRG